MRFPLNLNAPGSARRYDQAVSAAFPAEVHRLLDRLEYAMSGAKWYTSRMKLDEALYKEMGKELGGIHTPEDGLDELTEEEVPDQARARALTILRRGGPDALRGHISVLRGRSPWRGWDHEKEVRRRKRNHIWSAFFLLPILYGVLFVVPSYILGIFFDRFPTAGGMLWVAGAFSMAHMAGLIYDTYSKAGRLRWDELVAMEYDISETKVLDDQERAYLRTKGLV